MTRVNVAQEKGSELRDCKATVDLHKVPYTLTLTQGSKELNNINLASVVSLNISRSTAGPSGSSRGRTSHGLCSVSLQHDDQQFVRYMGRRPRPRQKSR